MMQDFSGLTGRVVGNYVLRTLIDQGGVGLVFIGEHRFLGDRVAVKVLHQNIDLEATDMSRRFFQEARATRSINHPNVVRIIDFGQDPSDNLFYLVMEFLEGHSMADVLKHGPLDERAVARIGAAVADGLHAAHDKGVIHRDLKPGNIFLCRDGTVKLLDFGLAKVKESGSQTAAGIVVGTPQYLAPEQVLHSSLVGPRTDVYGLGAVLFRMLAGRLPFVSDNMLDLVQHHISTPPPRLGSLVRVSPQIEALIMQCLEKEQIKRPASAREVRDRLLQIIHLAEGGEVADASQSGKYSSGDQTLVEMGMPAFIAAMVAEPQANATLVDGMMPGTQQQQDWVAARASLAASAPAQASAAAPAPAPRRSSGSMNASASPQAADAGPRRSSQEIPAMPRPAETVRSSGQIPVAAPAAAERPRRAGLKTDVVRAITASSTNPTRVEGRRMPWGTIAAVLVIALLGISVVLAWIWMHEATRDRPVKPAPALTAPAAK